MDVKFEAFPDDNVEKDEGAYLRAMDTMKSGDLVRYKH